jgi:hypothetical protein
MNPPSLPYPGHQNLESGKLPNGGYRVAYHDISPVLVHYVNNISISKGHRLISGFFGTGLLIAGFLDRILELAPETEEPYTITAIFGLLTSLVLIFICISRNFTIQQLRGILEQHVEKGGYEVLTGETSVKEELRELEKGKFMVTIPSPFLMLRGIELIPK